MAPRSSAPRSSNRRGAAIPPSAAARTSIPPHTGALAQFPAGYQLPCSPNGTRRGSLTTATASPAKSSASRMMNVELHRGQVRREGEDVAGLLFSASRLRCEHCLSDCPARKLVRFHGPALEVETQQLVEAAAPQGFRRLVCEHGVAGGMPLAAVVDARELGRPVVEYFQSEAAGGRIDARACNAARRRRHVRNAEAQVTPPREACDDLSAVLPGIRVVPAPEGVGMDPANIARLAAPRDDRNAAAAICAPRRGGSRPAPRGRDRRWPG